MTTKSQLNAQNTTFQFSLFHLFLFYSANCLLFGAAHFLGTTLTTLSLGIYVIAVAVLLLRIENPFFGGFVGLVLAVTILFGASLLQIEGGSRWLLLLAVFLYPQIGYTIGFIGVSLRSLERF